MHPLLQKLAKNHRLLFREWETLLSFPDKYFSSARSMAQEIAVARFGKRIVYRGIVEISNFCRNNCLYCGIRRDNHEIDRYRLSDDIIRASCEKGYAHGVRTFVLQGGEDPGLTDSFLCELIRNLQKDFPDARITLSLGERPRESYEALFHAGARRYLLRHETANAEHYRSLHPEEQFFWHRIQALYTLKNIGYQTGCGMMIGSPYQTIRHLAEDFLFIQEFRPHMVGTGPFLPHHATPFSALKKGSAKETLYVLSLLRILDPNLLLPATTALETLLENGYEEGILSGCNVIMPNMTPREVRPNYLLYDNKPIENEIAASLENIEKRLTRLGYTLESAPLDYTAS